jgi:hypothetical protein
MNPHPSNSDVQQGVGPLALSRLAVQLGVELEPRRIDMGDGVAIEVNGASPDDSVLVELNAHVGPVKGGQTHKLAADAFKLVWAGSRLGSTRLVLAVVDDAVEAYLRRPKAWLSAALVDNQVEVIQVRLPESVLADIADAQKRQYR